MEKDKIYNMDCLEGMRSIPDGSIDAIICDLPYGTTACTWDSIIPLEPLWEQYKRVIKPNGAIVLFSAQPFTTRLISSNMDMFKYCWVWKKDNATNFLSAKHQPLKVTEDICIFGKAPITDNVNGIYLAYNPQMRTGFKAYSCVSGAQKENGAVVRHGCKASRGGYETNNDGSRYPINILEFQRDKDKLHPTQKPIDLIRYLIRTYTTEGETILDNCIGSGTTAIACIKEKRHFIGFELDKDYYNIATQRIALELSQPELF